MKKWEHLVIVTMTMLTRFPERIFNPIQLSVLFRMSLKNNEAVICRYGKTTAIRLKGGGAIESPPENPYTSQHYLIDGFKGGP